jgi:hypothetical protein
MVPDMTVKWEDFASPHASLRSSAGMFPLHSSYTKCTRGTMHLGCVALAVNWQNAHAVHHHKNRLAESSHIIVWQAKEAEPINLAFYSLIPLLSKP